MDPIELLASCGGECWNRINTDLTDINFELKKTDKDKDLVRCMQTCFSAKTKQVDADDNLPIDQINKIKGSAYCGGICWNAAQNKSKKGKKAIFYCYTGCLASLFRPKPN